MAYKLDHVVIHVSDWERSNAFYRDVLGAEVVPRGAGFAYRIGDIRLNCHGPGIGHVNAVAKLPVMPGNSDICFEWEGPIEDAAAHLAEKGVPVELGPVATNGVRGPPSPSISAIPTARCWNSSAMRVSGTRHSGR